MMSDSVARILRQLTQAGVFLVFASFFLFPCDELKFNQMMWVYEWVTEFITVIIWISMLMKGLSWCLLMYEILMRLVKTVLVCFQKKLPLE